jgi:hypothetical protein
MQPLGAYLAAAPLRDREELDRELYIKRQKHFWVPEMDTPTTVADAEIHHPESGVQSEDDLLRGVRESLDRPLLASQNVNVRNTGPPHFSILHKAVSVILMVGSEIAQHCAGSAIPRRSAKISSMKQANPGSTDNRYGCGLLLAHLAIRRLRCRDLQTSIAFVQSCQQPVALVFARMHQWLVLNVVQWFQSA